MFKRMNLRPLLPSIAVVGFILGSASSGSAQDGLFSVGNLDTLSQLIVVGTINGGADGQLSLTVDRVIKGPASLGPNLSVAWMPKQSNECDTAPPAASIHAIWFLEKASDGSIEFARFMNSQPCHPSSPDYVTPAGPLNGGFFYGSSDRPRYKLAVELASALVNSTTVPVVIQHCGPGIFIGLSTTEAEGIAELLEGASDERVRMIGQLTMIRAGGPAGLELLASRFLNLAQTPLVGAASNPENSVATYKWQLAQAISGIRSTSARTIVVLTQIATNKDQDLLVRRAASRVLRNIHSAQAVVAIAPLVDDPDPLISTYALSAFACYANAVPVLDDTVPGQNLNLNREGPLKSKDTLAHFVIGPMGSDAPEKKAYWQHWWENHESSIQQAAYAAPTQ